VREWPIPRSPHIHLIQPLRKVVQSSHLPMLLEAREDKLYFRHGTILYSAKSLSHGRKYEWTESAKVIWDDTLSLPAPASNERGRI
jgi:hypothetical protein